VRLRGQDTAPPVSQAEAEEWLKQQDIQATVAAALAAVLTRLWTAAWGIGLAAAGALASLPALAMTQALADLLSTYAAEWADEIAGTVVRRLAGVLAQGGSAAQLAAAMGAVLSDAAAARRITLTETTRASGAAAYAWYQSAGVKLVRWVTEPPDPCALCIANEKAAPRSLGMPFPSGAIAPPQHPNCRCALIPAE
jgi:hypothetical protein